MTGKGTGYGQDYADRGDAGVRAGGRRAGSIVGGADVTELFPSRLWVRAAQAARICAEDGYEMPASWLDLELIFLRRMEAALKEQAAANE